MNLIRNVRFFSTFVGLVLASIVLFLTFQAVHLSTRYSFKEFFPKSNPVLNDEKKTTQAFDLSESPAFYVALTLKPSEAGHWLVPSRIDFLRKITFEIATIPGVKKVRSMANLDMALEQKNSLEIGPLLKNLPVEKWVPYVRSQPLLNAQLISNDFRSVLLYVEPNDINLSDLSKLEDKLSQASQGAQWTVSIAGVPAVQARVVDRLGREVIQFLVLSLILFCLMFLFFYRNFSPVLFAAIGLVITNVTSLGWLSLFHIPLTILLSTLPVIVSITFVSIVIHTLHLWSSRVKKAGSARGFTTYLRRSWEVLRELALPNLLGSVTTAIGFVVLATADIPAIRTYALVVAAVVIWTWFITQVLLIGFMHILNPVPRQWNHTRAWWMLDLSRWNISIISITVGVCVMLASTIPKMNFSGRLFDDLPKSESVRASTDNLDQRFGGTVGFDVSLRSARPDAWKDPQRLIRLQNAMVRIRRLPGIGSGVSVVDFLAGGIPASERAIAEVYFLYSLDQQNPLRQYLSNDFQEVRVAMRMHDLPSAQVGTIRDQVRPILQAIDPDSSLRESGLAVNSHTLNQQLAKQLVFGCWQSMFIIGLFLILIFRSVRWALIACLPNLVPPALLIGTLALFQTPIKPAIALIFSIALALAFNNTVYLLSRLKRVQAKMKMMRVPVRRALLEEGNPCFSESFIMLTGFLIYLTSDFKLNQTFGAYMVLSIFGGALGDLVFLPALLRRFSSFLSLKPVKILAQPVRRITHIHRGLFALFLIFCISIMGEGLRASEADVILQTAGKKLDAKSDEANVTIKIIEPNGESKERQFLLQTLQTKTGYKAMAKILAPADIRHTAVLSDVEGKNRHQWLYLPSTKKIRRIATDENGGGILGSELTAEDLNPTALQGATAKISKRDANSVVLELIPVTKTNEYDKVLVAFSIPEYLPTHTIYLLGDKVNKTVDFLNYKIIKDGIARAQSIKIKNQQNNRATDLEFSNVKVNAGLTDENFTESALQTEE